MNNYKELITNTIKELGVPAHLKGYHYVRYAIELMIDDISLIDYITKRLYPSVAEHFNTTATRVERSIRHAVETGWGRGDVNFANKLFGYTVDPSKGWPTNSEFMATIADYILMLDDNTAHKEYTVQ